MTKFAQTEAGAESETIMESEGGCPEDLTDKGGGGGVGIFASQWAVFGRFSSLVKSVASSGCLCLKYIYPGKGLHISY